MATTFHAQTLPIRRPFRSALASTLLVATISLAGCLPNRLLIEVTAADAKLRETTVLSDPAPEAKVALIHVSGFLVDARIPGFLDAGQSPVDELVARLNRAERDPSVRAVLMRVNSPGGTVTGSAVMAREIRRFTETTGKPVIASMGEVAASGGCYVALAADRVIAEPTSITASIGVIIQTFNFSGGLEMIGVRGRALTSGPNKDMGNPFQREREEHFALLQGMVDSFYGSFRDHVLSRRPAFDAVAHADCLDGRVVTGADAARAGLVDGVGGLRDAFEAAKGMTGVARAKLVAYHDEGREPRTPFVAHTPTAGAGDINLVQINAGALFGGTPPGGGFYYLWTPLAQ